MATVRFTVDEMDDALAPYMAEQIAPEYGERVWEIKSDYYAIKVRSSIPEHSSKADGTGENSIRTYTFVLDEKGQPVRLSGLVETDYITRVNGWDGRLRMLVDEVQGKLEDGVKRRVPVGARVFITKKTGKNLNRIFAKTDDQFIWLDEAEPEKKPAINALPARSATATVMVKKEESDGNLFDILGATDVASSATVGGESATPVVKRWEPTEEQKRVVALNVSRPIRIMATAGSGKTATLAEMITALVEDGQDPNRIVVVTFSKTQADDMLARIAQRCPKMAGSDSITTTHAFCLRMLRKYGGETREVAKDWQVKQLVNEVIGLVWDIGAGDVAPTYDEVLAVMNGAKLNMRWGDGSFFYMFERYGEDLQRACEMVDARMTRNGWMTFTDMLYQMWRRMSTDEIFSARVRNSFDVVMVDEAQDTNRITMEILRMVSGDHKRFVAVGDTDQMMYRFTGANDDTLHSYFERTFGVEEIDTLSVNWRSVPAIVENAQRVIMHNYARCGGKYEDKYIKECRAGKDGDGVVSFTMYDTQDDEMQAVATTVAEKLRDGTKPEQIFIMARTRAYLALAERPLLMAKIPFVNLCGSGFFNQRHVNHVLSYIQLAHNVANRAAFESVVNVSSINFTKRDGSYCGSRFLGKEFVAKCEGSYLNMRSVADRERRYAAGVRDFTDMMYEVKDALAQQGLTGAFDEVMIHYTKYLEYEEGVTEDSPGESKLADLEVLRDMLAGATDAAEFFAFVDQAKAATQARQTKDYTGFVVLGTIHRFKGLECDVAFLTGCVEGAKMTMSGEKAIGVLPHTAAISGMQGSPVLGIGGGLSPMEDERCIFFVGATRPRYELYMSGATVVGKALCWPSRFIVEAGLANQTESV